MAGKLFVKNTLPSNAHAAADAHELEMFDLFGDHDTDLVDVQIDEDEEALAAGMWTDYSAVFPMHSQPVGSSFGTGCKLAVRHVQ